MTKKNMRVFITGSSGLLGSTLIRTSPIPHRHVFATYHINTLVPNYPCNYIPADITKRSTIIKAIADAKPDVVIHTAAQASPDYCDKHSKEAYKVNVQGTKNIIDACKKLNIKIIYITTNGVYDGKHAPYDEHSKRKPVDVYGKTKLEGEYLTENSGVNYAIIRLNTMFGWNNPFERQNPVTWLLQLIGENKTSIYMVSDMYNTFLYVEESAAAIWKVALGSYENGYYNVSGRDCVSRYDFSMAIAKEFGLDTSMIHKVNRSFFTNFVQRPENTCFTNTKMKSVLGIAPLSIRAALTAMRQRTLTEKNWKRI